MEPKASEKVGKEGVGEIDLFYRWCKFNFNFFFIIWGCGKKFFL